MKKLYTLLSIGFLIFLAMQFPHAMINPGELVEGHQKLSNECIACHKPFGGVTNQKCIACHKIDDIGMDSLEGSAKTLFHQHLANQECSSCHTDHLGVIPEHPLSGFKHKLLSAAIINNCGSCHNKPADKLHIQVSSSCKSCHQTESWKNSIFFNHELLLHKSDCAACHQKPKDDYHNAVKENCDKCHRTSKWVPSTFDHSAYFKLDQKHNASCKTCHSGNNFTSYSCYGCHEHSEKNILSEHQEEGIYNISNCISCHKSGNEHNIEKMDNDLNQGEKKKIKDYIKSGEKEEKDDD